MALKELEHPEEVFGRRSGVTFRCGACGCGFFQEMRYIRFYDKGSGVYRYVIQTDCPNCKGVIAATSDGCLG